MIYPEGSRLPPDAAVLTSLLIPEQMDLALFRANCSHRDQRMVDCFAHGRFPSEDATRQVILGSWLERHHAAHGSAPPAVECYAADIARSLDGDATVLACGGIAGCLALHQWQYRDTAYHAAEIIRLAREHYGHDLTRGRIPVTVDMDGLGAGTGDILAVAGVWVIEFRGNATSTVDPRRYANLRAEAYGTLGRRLDPDDQWRETPWALPFDPLLDEELTAPEKLYGTDGFRFGITPKVNKTDREIESVKDKIGRSPDRADAVVYLFHCVRELHSLNQWFASYEAPMAVWPAPPPENGNGNGNGSNGHGAAPNAVGTANSPEPDTLLEWLERSYGRGGHGAAAASVRRQQASEERRREQREDLYGRIFGE